LFDDALKQMRDYGLIVDQPVLGDLQRVDVEGDRKGSRNGWYILFEYKLQNGNSIIAGTYGSWKRHDTQKIWLRGQGATKEDQRRIREKIAKQKEIAKKEREKAARRASYIASTQYGKLSEIGESEYLKNKGVKAHGIRFGREPGVLAIPLRSAHDSIVAIQWIFDKPKNPEQGNKTFWPKGADIAGASFAIGEIQRGEPIFIAEGYATGATIHEVLNVPVVVAFNSGNLVPVAKHYSSRFPDSTLVFCADDDWKSTNGKGEPYNAGVIFAKKASRAVQGYVVIPQFNRNRQDKDVDFNDLYLAEGVEAVTKCFRRLFSTLSDWQHSLGKTLQGNYKSDTNNIYLILSNDPAWHNCIRFCQLSYKVVKASAPPYSSGNYEHMNNEWRDDDSSRTDVWLSQNYGISAKTSVIDAAVDLVARDNSYHPVREYLEGLEWDGEHRIDTWLSEYLGAEESAYIRSAGKKWLIGAVARAMESPVKMDCVLILEGSQGAGKSTALRILGGQWFSDAAFQIGDKDGYQQMLGVWIMELAELDSFNKAESTRAKSFFATDSDRYRPPYGKRVVEYPRQCVFAGSTNQDSYFKDSTGNRRYWPVKCGEINLKALARDRDQLFAEALIGYKTGDSWHVTENEKQLFEREQGDRFLDDAWEALVVAYLDAPERITRQQIELAEIFTGALNMEPMTWRPPEQTRLAQILQRLGWKKVRPFCPVEKKRVYKYQRPDAGQVPGGSNE